MVWALTLGLYAFFPWLPGRVERAPQSPPGWTRYLVFFDPAIRRNLVLWLLFVTGLCGYACGRGAWHVQSLVGWLLASLFVVLLISMDLAGNTPLYKSGLHEDWLLHVELNPETCRGRAMCWEVCPKNCYVIDTVRRKAVIAQPNACVQCGACVVQCPEDALAFFTPAGLRIPPEVIRTYKLNLLGQRTTAIS